MLLAGVAAAQPTPAAPPAAPSTVVARAPAGQRELGVGFVQGVLTAKVCPQPGCSIVGGETFSLPPDAMPTAATLTVVRIAKERSVVHVVVPRASRASAWE